MKRLFIIVSISLILGLGFRKYVLGGISIATGSMEPSLKVGNFYLVNRFVYRFHAPERGDIILFSNPLDPEVGYVKRVIAIAGDDVEMREKKIYLNGQPLYEPYTQYLRSKEKLVGDTMSSVKVPEGKIFVLGDNRDVSDDATVWRDEKTGERILFIPVSSVWGRLIMPL